MEQVKNRISVVFNYVNKNGENKSLLLPFLNFVIDYEEEKLILVEKRINGIDISLLKSLKYLSECQTLEKVVIKIDTGEVEFTCFERIPFDLFKINVSDASRLYACKVLITMVVNFSDIKFREKEVK